MYFWDMNFLAHLYLSGKDDEVMAGNFLGDFCTSKQIERFTPKMQTGVELHREIDNYTDASPEFKKVLELLRPTQGKYSPVVADILFDHFLASESKYFSSAGLRIFSRNCEAKLGRYLDRFPAKAIRFFHYAKETNVWEAYADFEGLYRVFSGMHRRASFDNNMGNAVLDLRRHYYELKALFDSFFPGLEEHCREFRKLRDIE